jgi:hypothetical protein
VFGGLNRPLAAAVVALAVLVVPPAALACNGSVSAVNVYKECLPTGGGGSQSGTSSPHISKQTALALKRAGADGQSLSGLVKSFGLRRALQGHSSAAAAEPTAVGSAFDLGSGPTALLIILGATAVVLLGATGARGWRRSHRA